MCIHNHKLRIKLCLENIRWMHNACLQMLPNSSKKLWIRHLQGLPLCSTVDRGSHFKVTFWLRNIYSIELDTCCT